ncbi:hypothetical protein [Cellulomonas composti]|uniref:Uncharacterized protein n=1 Tax=Cellulomonas composti TaxID=266130 RepID=A0A511JEC8_9CELL|nr:hypothetical protein [Cellulomonas composti]GEL96348.1 hypothetical protein CCO02nite_30060 [Cellulomonas composti]
MTHDAGTYDAPPTGQVATGRPFPPPPWPLGPERPLPVTTGTPVLLRIVFTGIAVLFVGSSVQGLVDPSTVKVDESAVPLWVGILIMLGTTLVGVFCLVFAWGNTVVVDRHSVALRLVGMHRRADLETAARIVARPRRVSSGAGNALTPSRIIQIVVSSPYGRPVLLRDDLSDVGAALEVLTRWWYARPELVQDEQTAQILAAVAAQLARPT